MSRISGAFALEVSRKLSRGELPYIKHRNYQVALAFSQHWTQDDSCWIDREGHKYDIPDLEMRHLWNIICFLRKHAESIYFDATLHNAISTGAWAGEFGEPDDFDIPLMIDDEPNLDLMTREGRERWNKYCLEWLEETPLMQALTRTYEAWESDGHFADVEAV